MPARFVWFRDSLRLCWRISRSHGCKICLCAHWLYLQLLLATSNGSLELLDLNEDDTIAQELVTGLVDIVAVEYNGDK